MLEIRVPATSANLGPGFDCLGLALNLYNYIRIESSSRFSITLSGKYAGALPADESNLVWRTMLNLWQRINFPTPTVALHTENHIPPARGLGSSSAVITGSLLLANAYAGSPLNLLELLQIANEIEGHPDNVTPAIFGGITLSVPSDKKILPRILASKPQLKAVVVIPELLLKTKEARAVLPPQVKRKEAVYNIAHTALMVEAFLREDYSLLAEGMQDKLHQDRRAALIPGLKEALLNAMSAGAYGSALSGSGPTIIALCKETQQERVGNAMMQALKEKNVHTNILFLEIDSQGAVITKTN